MSSMMSGRVRLNRSLQPSQLFRMIGELRAAKVALFELMRLDHRPHRTVEHEDPREQQLLEAGDGGCGC